MLLSRHHYISRIQDAFELYPICTLLGPRQCGKTTLAHQYIDTLTTKQVFFFDLEDPAHLDQLLNPKATLDPLSGLIVIDEIQRRPELFPYLRVLADYSKDKKFLLLGSASGTLLQQSSESLAGRVEYIELTPFSLFEVNEGDFSKLWSLGGFPKSFMATNYSISLKWRKNYILNFIERDLPFMGIHLNGSMMRHLLMMLAHNHGQLLNYSDLGRSLGTSDMTIRRYIDILLETFIVRKLEPWFENISKRLVKAPKIYIRDSGLLHALLGIDEMQWIIHPKKGASFEGFAIEEIIKSIGNDAQYYFWRTQTGTELDLLIIKDGKRLGFEIKLSDTPHVTESMRNTIKDLKLDYLYIINPHEYYYQKEEKIAVLGLQLFQKLDFANDLIMQKHKG